VGTGVGTLRRAAGCSAGSLADFAEQLCEPTMRSGSGVILPHEVDERPPGDGGPGHTVVEGQPRQVIAYVYR